MEVCVGVDDTESFGKSAGVRGRMDWGGIVGFFENYLWLDLKLDGWDILGCFTKIWGYVSKFSEL